jgi:PAS domain S-box-containing protein
MMILIFPVLYFFSFRPLIRQMEKSWQAEESLLQSRELQEKFFDSINTFIAYMDRDFNFIRVNNAYARADRRTPDFFVGKNHFVLYPNPENQQIFQHVVETGEPFIAFERPFEYAENPERGVTYWDWNLQPVKGTGGRVEGLVLSLLDVTERRRAQDANRQLSRIVEQTEDTVVVTNCDGLIEYVNPAFERLTGYTKQEALGKTPRVLKSGIHNVHFYEKLWNTLLKGEVFQSEIANRKKNGDLFYEVKTIAPLRDAHGNITHFVATGKDITEHKYDEEQLQNAYRDLELRVQARTEELSIANSELEEEIIERKKVEEALRRSEALLLQTGEMARVGGWELDLQTMTLDWSLETYRIHEVDPSIQPDLESAINFYVPEARPLIREAVQQAIEKGISYDLELPMVTAQGKPLWIRTIGQSQFGEGKCMRIIGTFQDITQRKQAEDELRIARDELELRVQERTQELAVANQELLREIAEREEIERVLRTRTTAMETAASGIVITDRQGKIQWINPALVQISGYEASELIGQDMHIFKSGQHEASYYRQLWETILAGKVWRGETTNRRKNASLYIEEQTITPVRDHHGEIIQFIAVKQDITERKKAEQEIWERDQKEKILTQTIYTMQLDIARDLHDTLGQNISYLRMKLDHLAERKIRKQAEMQLEIQEMARAANESYDLMRGTLAVLQSENSTDLFRLFTRYAQQIEERSAFKINFFSHGEPRFISAKRMRQLFYIFREILSNIEKHANATEVCLELAWNRDDLELAVSDNGCGFDVHQVQYGSHYGLKFMRERAELLNGLLTIQSGIDSGTNIKLQVPYE